jgi:hypothetical protein
MFITRKNITYLAITLLNAILLWGVPATEVLSMIIMMVMMMVMIMIINDRQ